MTTSVLPSYIYAVDDPQSNSQNWTHSDEYDRRCEELRAQQMRLRGVHWQDENYIAGRSTNDKETRPMFFAWQKKFVDQADDSGTAI
jgi:hypothetical protein